MSNARRLTIIGEWGAADLARALQQILEAEQVETLEALRNHAFEIHAPPEMPEFCPRIERPRQEKGPQRVRGRGKKAYRNSL